MTELTRYSIYSMGHVVGTREARTPDDAVVEYLLSQGYDKEEIVRSGSDAISWRGAIFTAVPVTDEADRES